MWSFRARFWSLTSISVKPNRSPKGWIGPLAATLRSKAGASARVKAGSAPLSYWKWSWVESWRVGVNPPPLRSRETVLVTPGLGSSIHSWR